MNKKDLRLCKKKILKCLTENIVNSKDKVISRSLFDKKDGFAQWTDIDLEMVIDKVVLGLYFALKESEENNDKI